MSHEAKWSTFKLNLQEVERFQKEMKARHAKDKCEYISTGGGENVAPFTEKPSCDRAKSSPPGFGGALEEVIDKSSLNSFEVKDDLHPAFWADGHLSPEIIERLLEIVDDFLGSLEFDVPLIDVKLTGSLANYNWSKYSDIDLHIVTDFEEIDDNEELLRKLFRSLTTVWNDRHDIVINEHEVEIYIENVAETHISTGVYSIQDGEWLVKPEPANYEIDTATIKKKTEAYIERIDAIEDTIDERDYADAFDQSEKLKAKIRNMRKAGLEEGGEFSVKNLVFKLLRRIGELDRLSQLKDKAYDSAMTI